MSNDIITAEPAKSPSPARVGSCGELAKGLALAQQKCKAVVKDAVNRHHNYAYASGEAIIEAANEALEGSGVTTLPLESYLERYQEGEVWCYELRRTFLVLHASGESLVARVVWPVVVERGRPLDKAAAIADTVSLSYFLRDLLRMPRIDPDDDLAGRADRPPQRRQPQPQPAPRHQVRPRARRRRELEENRER